MSKKLIKNLIVVTSILGLTGAVQAATQKITAPKTTAPTTQANQNIEKEFDALGGNGVLLEKAQALNPEVRTTVVQNRIVDRTNRFELSGEYANSFGGDTYVRSGILGLSAQYHLSNHWSLGAKSGMAFNKLTAEGESLVKAAEADAAANPLSPTADVPAIDYPKQLTMGFVNFYPLYGKISWLGKGISHFDVYGQLGYGNISLKSGGSTAMSAGAGVGVWGNEHLTTRLEMTYLDYTAKYINGNDIKMGVTSASVQVGWLF
ncbi:MAG: outer membrane beta-barrel domain-containing protein [Moraxellaceae bacterium]|nr:outer membrane beta-barrel domain-containing protein [Pseudobdellovibrionaceae bacterium]